jgi:hypothetical protein
MRTQTKAELIQAIAEEHSGQLTRKDVKGSPLRFMFSDVTFYIKTGTN